MPWEQQPSPTPPSPPEGYQHLDGGGSGYYNMTGTTTLTNWMSPMNNDVESSVHSLLSEQPALERVAKGRWCVSPELKRQKPPKNNLMQNRKQERAQCISSSGTNIIEGFYSIAQESIWNSQSHCFAQIHSIHWFILFYYYFFSIVDCYILKMLSDTFQTATVVPKFCRPMSNKSQHDMYTSRQI